MSIQSSLDGSIAYGKFLLPSPESERRNLKEGDVGSQADLMAFSLEVTEHSALKMKLQIYFDNPNAISSLAADQVSLEIKELDVFRSALGENKIIQKSSFPGGVQKLVKQIPPMMSDEEQVEQL